MSFSSTEPSDSTRPDEVGLALCIYGEALEPNEITSLLGSSPTHSHRKGEIKGRLKRPYDRGAWILEVRTTEPIDIDALAVRLFSPLSSDEALWRDLSAKFEMRVHLAVHTDVGCNFIASSATMQLFAARHVALLFDIYAYGNA